MTLIHIQPALPSYRIDFFHRLASHYGDSMRVHYSPVDMGALTASRDRAPWEYPIGPMLHPIRSVEWQVGALSVRFRHGDTVVVCGAPRNLSTLLLLARAQMIGARTVWWGQYWSATTQPNRHRLRMKLSRLADALLFYTDAEVNRFHADGWTHPGPVDALNNGIDLTEVRSLRRPYNAAQRTRNLLFIGRLTEKAQLRLAINALADPILENVHLHVIGGGSEESSLRLQANKLNVSDRITWYGGTTEEARIAKVANRCAAFVYPGQVGLSLIHAMGYGLPCVVHDQPLHHMPEIAAFEDGATGKTFKEGDATALAMAVSAILDAPDLATHMAARCQEKTETDYTTEGMAKRFIAFLDRLDKKEAETVK
jgi:glycosyltransferase involved in cell wall biosynthesis